MNLIKKGEVKCPFCQLKLDVEINMEKDPYIRYIKCDYCKKSFYADTRIEIRMKALPQKYVESNGKNIEDKERKLW